MKSISFNFSSDREYIYCDRARIKIILSNFIGNSIQYRDESKPKPFINVDVVHKKDVIRISVGDNGIGIPDGETKKIFKMFYRANHKSKGSGLGLYVVNETAQKLKGAIEIESEPGLGSTFVLIIPVRANK